MQDMIPPGPDRPMKGEPSGPLLLQEWRGSGKNGGAGLAPGAGGGILLVRLSSSWFRLCIGDDEKLSWWRRSSTMRQRRHWSW